MKKFSMFLLMFVAVISTAVFTSCSDDDEESTPKVGVSGLVVYKANLSSSILYYYDAKVTYVDPSKSDSVTEVINDTVWSKSVTATKLPAVSGGKLKLTRKENVVIDRALNMSYTILCDATVLDRDGGMVDSYFYKLSPTQNISEAKVSEYLKNTASKTISLGNLTLEVDKVAH